jgi:hypothetical protein
MKDAAGRVMAKWQQAEMYNRTVTVPLLLLLQVMQAVLGRIGALKETFQNKTYPRLITYSVLYYYNIIIILLL